MAFDKLPICSVSGGKDSTALYCLMVEFLGKNFLPIFADTGNEHPVTVNYVRNLHLMAGGPRMTLRKLVGDSKCEYIWFDSSNSFETYTLYEYELKLSSSNGLKHIPV